MCVYNIPCQFSVISPQSLLQGHITGSSSNSCQLWLPGPLLLSCFPAGWCPAYIGVRGCYWCRSLNFSLLTLEVSVSPILQHVKVPLNCSTTLWHISHSSQFCVTYNHLVICKHVVEQNPSIKKTQRASMHLHIFVTNFNYLSII